MPYTRSARAAAVDKIKDGVAVFAGSRYGYIKGIRVRLDDTDLLHAEAVTDHGAVYIPSAFAAAMMLKSIAPKPIPTDLSSIADRWVNAPEDLDPDHGSAHRKFVYVPTPGISTCDVNAMTYYSFADVAKASGQTVTTLPSGVVYAGPTPLDFAKWDRATQDSVVTLFDTPEKYADPDIATRSVPSLTLQGKWTDHVRVTPEQLAILNGKEEDWPLTPQSEYDYAGFDLKILGSKVPPPGIYPRLLFSPEDVPVLAARVKSTITGQKSLIEMEQLFRLGWWNPATPDGKVFRALATGDVAGLEWDCPPGTPPSSYPNLFKGQKPSIYNTHVWYVPECLTSMALYCLLTGDDARGKQVATAIANYYKLREPLLDEINSLSDTEFGSGYLDKTGTFVALNGSGATGHWRSYGLAGGGGIGAHMNLGLALDFAGKWMTADEKDSMRRFIAKATYGVRGYGQDGPRRWRDINWVTWDLSNYLALTEIEGLEGFDPEASASNVETVRCFCEWGIDPDGVIYESNGKTPGGLQFLTLAMTGMARRGDNFFGHPHFRKLLLAQVQSTSPSGRVTVNSGTQYEPYSRQHMSFQFLDEMNTFFPQQRESGYLLECCNLFRTGNETFAHGAKPDDFDRDAYAASLAGKLAKLRLPSVTYPGFVQGVLYDSDFQPVTRENLHLPLDFSAPTHGLFSSYSDRSLDAAWINLLVRPDHYLGAGHHHADSGMFHFSALGVDWFTQSALDQVYDGTCFSLVQVDGHSEPESIPGQINGYNGRATYLGAQITPNGADAAADLTYAYSYRWSTQPPPQWGSELSGLGWELEPNPEVLKFFAGTARYKMRPWWMSGNSSNYMATSRAPFNPMQYVFRTAGLVRGEHAYGFVVDDLKKDDQPHLYQWVAMLNGGVRKANITGLGDNQIALAYRDGDPDLKSDMLQPAVTPQPGEPLLLVCALGMQPRGDASPPLMDVERVPGPRDKTGARPYLTRLIVNQRGPSASYRIFLLPWRAGENLPTVIYDASKQTASVTWKDQSDTFFFRSTDSHRTLVSARRGSVTIIP